MALQPDVRNQQQHQQHQEHQRLQEQQNIVYIQQDPQNYRSQNYQYSYEGQNNIIRNQSFQQQNADFGQFENQYPFVNNGHFSPPNSTAALIQQQPFEGKTKNASPSFRNPQFSDNDSVGKSNGTVHIAGTAYQSVDLQNLNYQQQSQFFLQNIGHPYQLNDILVPAYQSSGSSESSDESSLSNISQTQYSNDSNAVLNNQFEFPVPIPVNNQVRNFQQQQKDFLDNYASLLHQDTQVPRCDSSKSEAAESTCSSLSSGSSESQSENENIVRLPVLLNPILHNNGNCNVLHPYQNNTPNASTFSNPVHHTQNDVSDRSKEFTTHSDQNLVNFNSNYDDFSTSITNGSIENIQANNQMNNLIVMMPNRSKNLQNIMTNPPILQNPSSDMLNTSKFTIQNPKNEQKLYGVINFPNQLQQGKLPLQEEKFIQENFISNRIGGKNENCGGFEENRNVDQNQNCDAAVLHLIGNHTNGCDVIETDTSQIHYTSDSSVINANFVQSDILTKPLESETSAIFLKETSEKSINQCISDVNNSSFEPNSNFSVKTGETDAAKKNTSDVSNAASCLSGKPSINGLPVPVGWKRLLVDGSVIYLSPSNIALSTIEQVKMYLQTGGTCKCGLECPVNCDSVFNFNPKVISRPWDSSDSELTRLCNHKRKASASSVPETDKNIKLARKEVIPVKRKKKKLGNNCSGVSVSQLLAQRDRALAAAAARWSSNTHAGNLDCQTLPNNQYQNVQIVRNQPQALQQITYENNIQLGNNFKPEAGPAQGTDDKAAHFPCVNVINNPGREGAILNINGMNQLLPENHSASHELLRQSQTNLKTLVNPKPELGQPSLSHPINYNQPGQDLLQNAMIGPRAEGVVLAPQGMILPPGVVMHRPRSIPPWHQTKLGLSKKQVPETPVMYERVPCIQQHMPPPALVFEDVTTRKKHKSNSKTKKPLQCSAQNQPSFMENPSAYLAQQTALLHNTISLPNFSMTPDNRPITVLPQTAQNHSTTAEGESISTTVNTNTTSNVLLNSTRNPAFAGRPAAGQKIDQNSFSQSQICHKLNHETSTNQTFGDQSFNNHVCSNVSCSECKKFSAFDNEGMKENFTAQTNRGGRTQESLRNSNELLNNELFGKNDWRRSNSTASDQVGPSRTEDQINAVQENPVTSSTEKAPIVYNQKIVSDTRPIQGGAISTSNGSPQPQSSPKSSSFFRQEVLSPKCTETTSRSPNRKPFSVSNSVSVGSTMLRESETASHYQQEYAIKKEGIVASQASPSDAQQPQSPEQKCKFSSPNMINVTTSDQKSQRERENLDEFTKSQSVTSSLDFQKEENKKEKSETKNRIVRTMASGHTVSSNTITSVQAGKTQTATVSVNNNSPISPTTISLVNFSNQNNPNLSFNQKTSTKSPLEMVQSVVSSIQTSPAIVKNDMQPNILSVNKTVLPTSNVLNNILTTASNITTSMIANNSNSASLLKTSPGGLQTGHILVSNNGQYIVASSGNVIPQTSLSGLKLNQAMPSMNASPVVTNVTGAVTQVLPAVGVAQQVLGQPTVLVNTLPAPFVIQPGVMTVATGNVLPGNLIENNSVRSSIRSVNTPEKVKNKKGNKKRKNQMTSLIQMASPNNVILNQQFSQQNFAVSPGGSVQSLPALTLVQGKHGASAQILMSNQNNFNQFNAQPQQINLLQPVNLASVPNFPAFQQFIVPGLGNMVMSTDGTTTILPDTNIGVQLQLQNVNGQSVLTPVQNTSFINGQGILTAPAGMLIRAPNAQQKIIQNNSSPQFLSPNNNQFLVNQFQGQLSPLIAANLSPNQQIFTSSPPRQSPQEYIQIIPTSSSQNTTVVQQNTTIVQQQTTMVSNNQNILNNPVKSNFILNNPSEKPLELQFMGTSQRQAQSTQSASSQHRCSQEKVDTGTQHSVSTQTVINKETTNPGVTTSNTFCQTSSSNWSGSPPDTTTHSPVESESNRERTLSPSGDRPSDDCLPQAMVQYVSSSISENDSESETYLLPGMPKLLTSSDILSESNDKAKNVVESSTVLQESGGQLQIGNGYAPSRRLKANVDECVVSSHSDIGVQDTRVESLSSITCFQEDKAKLVDAFLSETRPHDLDEEAKYVEVKEKLSEGDLVWGSARGSLAWPGKLVGPVSPGGKVLVRWFGGHGSPSRVHVSKLQSLSQGLEAHHRASNKGRKNRRLNAELEAAIQEAMLELDKMSAQEKKVSGGNGRPRRSNR